MDVNVAFPSQKLSFKAKGEKWRRQCVDWAANRTYFNYTPVRKDAVHMKINYDLVNGIIHMDDVARILNPGDISTAFLPDKIQHYPIINSKLNTLRGEEAARVFDWKVIVTNPNSISAIEEERKKELFARVQGAVEDTELSNREAEQQVKDTTEYMNYTWQDLRELRANEFLRHYSKELNFKQTFNDGFIDASIAGIEAYQCGISGGEPFLKRINPINLRIFRNGYSNHIEDADIVIYEDYWPRGRIIDTYKDELSEKDVKWLSDEVPDFGGSEPVGAAGNYDERVQFLPGNDLGIMINNESGFGRMDDIFGGLVGGVGSDLLPYDVAGNIRVVQVWWKSLRLVYKVKSFDPITGEEVFDFYPETYVPNTDAGEVAEKLWINQMWQGTKIGENIYVGIRPCIVQHNTISNPSRCHSGIVGTIYNLNDSKPFSLVDMMKPYNYLYDAVSAKFVDLIATNWGKLLEMDLALKPKDWEVEKWMYFARVNKVLIKDSFNEGAKGAATGKLAGGLNNATKGYIDADWGNSIQNYVNILISIKDAMSEIVGINRQREGNTYNRETVGGIERAVMQSSYITDWLFQKHDDTKKRVLESFLEYAKAAVKGRSVKFQYILSDYTRRIMEFSGDDFCESSYGLVVDNSNDTQKLNAQLDSLAQAALQNQYRLSTITKLYTSASIGEKIRTIEKSEQEMVEQQRQAQEAQMQIEQQKAQAEQQARVQEAQFKDELNRRDNETKIKVAEINSRAEYLRLGIYSEENDEQIVREKLDIEREKLAEEIRQFDKELRQRESEQEDKKEIELKKIAAQNAQKRNTK